MTYAQNPIPQPVHVPETKRSNRPLVVVGATLSVFALLCCGAGIAAIGDADEPSKFDAVSVPTTAPATTPQTPRTPAASTTSAAPATDPETATPTEAANTPAPAKPRVIKGNGDDVVDIRPLTEIAVVVFNCRCSSNTVLKSDGPESLLVNEIGAYKGKRWINVSNDAQTTQFEIEAVGSWTLTIDTVDQLATKASSGKASGKGDDVVVLGGNATKARITHSKGTSNFAVHAYSLETGIGGLLVNEIGGYAGTRPLQAPALVQITADGNWSISPL